MSNTSLLPRRHALAVAIVAGLGLSAFGLSYAAPPSQERLLVAFKPGAAAEAAVRASIANGGGHVTVDLTEVGVLAVSMPAQAAAGLARHPQVEYVEADPLRFPMATTAPSSPPYQPGQTEPYGIRMVQADQVSDTEAANRTLCIVDSGLDTAHEDLAGIAATGQNLTRSGEWFTDEAQHGTHVAGTIAARDNSVGVVGVLPGGKLKLNIQKVFDASGSARSSTINRAALNCVKAGANVINMSLGGSAPTRSDERVFNKIAAANVLSIAAAGNAGDTTISYPAGYASVMSVAAVDVNMAHASFSQSNATVEIAGPGVEVLSTVPTGSGRKASLAVDGSVYAPQPMEGSPVASVAAPLADFGLGDVVTAGAMSGKVCLIQRGTISFADKVLNCQASGGLGAVIYNNVAGALFGTLGTTVTTIPSVGVSDTEGAAMLAQVGTTATLSVTATSYAFFDGTSMATPHVAAVAALVWSRFPTCTAAQIRSSLNKSAMDLGSAGRDDDFGNGLVQAKAAVDRIDTLGCSN